MKRSSIQRKTPLSRKGWPQGRSARVLVKRSDKAQDFADELDAVTPALLERAGYRCEICRYNRIEHRHHRLRRSQGGTNDLTNLLALCGVCHGYVHANPTESYRQGWLLSSGKGVKVASD